ncbi:GNAT family N-acetyltransferase [Acidaminobacter sp.]|uniref:GNAT family N-acetyltransferase n=1 Tax=Acidaminobacter sp. TaxID=1872102 RepID=UPI0025617FC8|nr:GNAT family N-acetyltransferase [Acidaminobacter sp.]MDK9712359.1 GNAT family N-acetyltransferase [Acidaminobacter sp.]
MTKNHTNPIAQIRTAVPSDLPRLTDIYNQAIETFSCTCDTTPFTPEDRLAWFNDHQTDRCPLFVYESEGQVLGYAYLSPYRSGREALRSIAEISYYVDFSAHRRGVATHLVHHTLHAAHHLGYKNLVAILLECNTPSIALLESFGFEPWGTLPMVAELQNQHVSHLYYGLKL